MARAHLIAIIVAAATGTASAADASCACGPRKTPTIHARHVVHHSIARPAPSAVFGGGDAAYGYVVGASHDRYYRDPPERTVAIRGIYHPSLLASHLCPGSICDGTPPASVVTYRIYGDVW